MEHFDSTKQVLSTVFTNPTSLMYSLEPVIPRGISGLWHLVLLLVLFVLWVCKKVRVDVSHNRGSKEMFRNNRGVWNKLILYCCLGVSVFNLVFCLLSYFFWYRNAWSAERLVTLFDLVLKVLAWGAICVCLQNQFFNFGEQKLPFLLRVWWGFYLFNSCYFLGVDIIHYKKHESLPNQCFVSDVVSVIAGLFLCYVGSFWGRNAGEDTLFGEPLLNGVSNGEGPPLKSKGAESVTPYSNAGPFSLLTFSWIGSLIAICNKRTVNLEDIPQLDSGDSVVGAFPILRNKLEADGGVKCGLTTLKLTTALIFTVWKDILLSAVVTVLYTLASYVGPYLINTFVQHLNGKRRVFSIEGYLLVFTFFIAKIVECLCHRLWFFKLEQVGIKIRAVLVVMIYNKSLTLSCQAKRRQTSGKTINFMTVDAERVGNCSQRLHDPWMIVMQIILAFLILYKNLGLASVATLLATMIVMLGDFPLGKLQKKIQSKLMDSKDNRMKATSEILRNMRILKLQGWEMKFLSQVIELRKTETGWLKKFCYTSAVTNFVFWNAPTFVSLATFGACILLGIPLESGNILSALATFRILQQPIRQLPETISMMIQTKVSLDRIAAFLQLEDLQSDVVERQPSGSSDTAIEVVDGNFSWDNASTSPTLKDINLKVSHGMRVAVCGTVGSGKSTLLSCILGEVPKISGTLKLCGTKAYVSQSPWIQSGKIEENILFGKEMDRERYDRVLKACSLMKDLEILSFGDQTVIGERGINLSGGQKQRIQIARALYHDTDIYLFDDPFSAVDAHTGSHLFKEVLLGLLRSKTIIYVTHQVEFLHDADLILVMKDGKIAQAGKYSDILNSGTDFMELVGAHKQALSALDARESGSSSEKIGISKEIDGSSSNGVSVSEKEDNKVSQNCKSDDVAGPKGQLVQEEEREKGKVGFSVYWKYITAAYGGALVPVILLTQFLFQFLQIGSNYWMAWATPVSKDVEPPVGGSTLILVYVAMAIGSSFCVLVRATLLATAGYKIATLFFNKMHLCIFRAPMSFFDATPSGRILIRVSTDQSSMDLSIPNKFGAFLFSSVRLLGIIVLMSQVAWQIFIIFMPVLALCIWYRQYQVSCAQDLSRLSGVCKAPLIQHFAETISGSTTVRGFDQEARFKDTIMELMDGYSRPLFHFEAAMQWLCLRMNMLSTITFAFSLICLISIPEGVISPAIAGLVVAYGLDLSGLQAEAVWNLCSLEKTIISVERILQYTCISSEPPLVVEANQPDHFWPSHGEVDIRDLKVRYAPDMPLVLQGLTCTFPGGKKTGIVGRTGSGKSTLIQTMFRIVEPAAGRILIDGIDISVIGLHVLRSRLSIIPQDPTMFEGTLRKNLDPLEEYTDDQIWEALDKCQLGDEIRKKEGMLDSRVSENGENLSMGERQLVCLGRVLLKKSKVLVLDEATASVDTTTDNLIQQTLRQHFSDCTVITIAHRITSVVDCDMVLLLSHGLIEEHDSPTKLLEDKSSSFAQLVAEYTNRSNSSCEI